jgi:hypothetical protein
MSRKLAQENASKLASIGVAAMEYEVARRRAYTALQEIRAARRNEDERPATGYAQAAKDRKNARERMQRLISRYRDWLDGVNQ